MMKIYNKLIELQYLLLYFYTKFKNNKMKNYITEFIGTFFLVLTIGLTGDPIAIGTMLMVMVYMGGHISGAHYNPAVSIAMIIRGILSVKEAVKYILFQIAGAILAAFLVNSLLSVQESYKIMKVVADVNDVGYSPLQILLIETIFTFALVLVILNVATNPKTEGNSYYGLAIGFTIMAAAFAGGAISGGAYNPAVGIGPAVASLSNDYFPDLWYYLVGPIAGAVLATYIYKLTTD